MVRLLELRIRDFRGIRSIDIALGGKNGVILGPNGSGKSSVVDAVDFLLTGRIDRLTGQGTGSASLGKHGHHLQASAESAFVEADFECDGHAGPFCVRRSLVTPDRLEVPSKEAIPPSLLEYLQLANDTKLHLLTRRQILAFILAEPAKRGELVGALLRTEAIDQLRKELQGAAKTAAEDASEVRGALNAQSKALLRTVDPAASDVEALLERVNANRAVLGGVRCESLAWATILEGIPELAKAAADPLQTQRVRDSLRTVHAWKQEAESRWLTCAAELEARFVAYRQNEAQLITIRSMRLVTAGQALVTSGQCPLCLTKWDEAELRAHLAARLAEGQQAVAEAARLDDERTVLQKDLSEPLAALTVLASSLEDSYPALSAAFSGRAGQLSGYLDFNLRQTQSDRNPTPAELDASRKAASDIETLANAIAEVNGLVARLPNLVGAQKAWDELSATSRQLADISGTAAHMKVAGTRAKHLDLVHQSLVRARDEVLQAVYDSIAARLDEYYAELHAHDKDGFSATIEPTKAGLKLEVGFHGIGAFPPTAVHSEGHQDSMGVCLFLALVDYLASATTGPILLDDVVMSVDREHRRGVARLLATQFPTTQFLLTTHDRVWFHQLRTTGVVGARQQLIFPSWNLATGPAVDSGDTGFLAEARAHFEAGRVASAAHALRRGFEMAGPDLCDSLGAQLRFRADGGWSAGEYMDGALSRYARLLKKARSAAQSWKHDLSVIEERERSLAASNTALGGERWAVNALVHFNEWAELAPADFEPVIAAHEQLFAQFHCSSCESTVRAVEADGDDVTLRCHCGLINLNLAAKVK